jgi:hypothetical protein
MEDPIPPGIEERLAASLGLDAAKIRETRKAARHYSLFGNSLGDLHGSVFKLLWETKHDPRPGFTVNEHLAKLGYDGIWQGDIAVVFFPSVHKLKNLNTGKPEMNPARRRLGNPGSKLPPMERLPETGQYAAVRTLDGSIYFDPVTTGGRTHLQLIEEKGIPKDQVADGGWLIDGVYEPTLYSDSGRIGEKARAQLRARAKFGNPVRRRGAR